MRIDYIKNLVKRLLLISVSMWSMCILCSSAYSADGDWLVHIKVSAPDAKSVDGSSWNHLIAGVRDGAGNGFDSSWDTISLTEADDAVQAMFNHGIEPEDKDNNGSVDRWTCKNPEDGYTNYQCGLWRDLRAFEEEKVWSFVVLSPLNGGNVTLEWSFENKPENIEIKMVDLSNPAIIIDMKSASRYDYTNNFEPGKKYGIRHFEIRMKANGLFLIPPMIPDATSNMPYDFKLLVVGGNPEWSIVSGELPPGMSLNSITGEIQGTPTAAGIYKFTINGNDKSTGYSISREFTLNINSIPQIYTSRLPDTTVGSDYKVKVDVNGGSTPLKWNVNGNLPEGLTLDSNTGVIAGKLIVPGIYDFTVNVTDINMASDSRDFRIVVIEPDDNTAPDTINDLKGLYSTDSSLLLVWSAPLDNSKTHTPAIYDLRYMENCSDSSSSGLGLNEASWDNAIEAIGEPKPQSGTMHTYTLTGLTKGIQYCIAVRSMDASGNISGISNLVKLPLSADAQYNDITALTSSITLSQGYNFISVPFIPVPNGRDSLFGTLGTDVSLYRWYSAYPDITPPQYYLEDVVEPGYGYFLYSPANNVKLNIDGLKIEDDEYGIELQDGWNMVGTPYNQKVLLSNISVKNVITGEVKSYVNAVKTGWIGNSIYSLKSGNYEFASFNDDPPAALEPWVGYWIYVNSKDAVEIVIKKP